MFWIGRGRIDHQLHRLTSRSAWDENWRSSNRGSDTPNNRNGYASADHASTVNTFYVALPFNDLAFPDKAREWVPRAWHRPNKDGKQVSACKDRWVEIKNSAVVPALRSGRMWDRCATIMRNMFSETNGRRPLPAPASMSLRRSRSI